MAVSRRDTGVTVVHKNAKSPRALETQVEIKNGQIGGEPSSEASPQTIEWLDGLDEK